MKVSLNVNEVPCMVAQKTGAVPNEILNVGSLPKVYTAILQNVILHNTSEISSRNLFLFYGTGTEVRSPEIEMTIATSGRLDSILSINISIVLILGLVRPYSLD